MPRNDMHAPLMDVAAGAPGLQGMARGSSANGPGQGGMNPAASQAAHAGEFFEAEDSPSYAALRDLDLMSTQFRVASAGHLDARKSNTSRNICAEMSRFFCCCCGVQRFEVPAGHIKLLEDGRGNYEFAGSGLHQIIDLYTRVHSGTKSIANDSVIKHGDRCIITVDQGYIGYATDKGSVLLLPPGLHQWKSPTIKFERMVDLNSHVINMGPLTLLTVDEGYCAVTQNNGHQEILAGGATHLLTHRNWKFEKFVTKKIQTNDLEEIQATSADNVLMCVSSTVAWVISDVDKAASQAIGTMNSDGSDLRRGSDIEKLKMDVLKQAEASLSSFIGTVNYSGTFAVNSSVHQNMSGGGTPVVGAVEAGSDGGGKVEAPASGSSGLFDDSALLTAKEHANEAANRYGVTILSINIISAKPADSSLMKSLASGAVAAAEAQQAETAAYGRARAAKIEAEGHAQAAIIEARADAEAEVLRAEGASKAAKALESSPIAVELARIDKTGAALKDAKSSMFFGASATDLSALLSNPNVTGGR